MTAILGTLTGLAILFGVTAAVAVIVDWHNATFQRGIDTGRQLADIELRRREELQRRADIEAAVARVHNTFGPLDMAGDEPWGEEGN